MAENPENNATTSGVTIGVVKESLPGETRVGLIPDSVKHLVGKGLKVVMQAGAGEGSSIADSEYEEAGAHIVPSTAEIHSVADVVVRVQAPSSDRGEMDGLKRDQVLVSYLAPLSNHDLNRQLANSGVTAMAVDAVPRITRAQSMDALSAMSTISGYKAVLLAAERLPKFFPLLMTAAGTIRPAKVLVLGAGVAGLQAIATARRLGAVVEAYDVRAVVKEQVESLGAKFVEIDTGAGNAEVAGGYAREATPEELKKQQEGLNEHIANSDVVITTALVPGRPAPKMIPASAVERMRAGSVIVDLAAETGGNCELTTPGEVTKEHGVSIFGTLNLPATLPVHASQMYGKVMTNFLDLLVKDGQVNLNFDDEIISSMTITNRGEIVQAQTRKMMGLDEVEPIAAPEPASSPDVSETGGDEPEPAIGDTNDFDGSSDTGLLDDVSDEVGPTSESSDGAESGSTYIPFAEDDSAENSNDVAEPESTYEPFADKASTADQTDSVDAVSDPSTEIASYSVDEGYETVADQPPVELEDESVASERGEAVDGSSFAAESDYAADSLAADDGTYLDVTNHSPGSDNVSADDGSDESSESSSFPEDDSEGDQINDDGFGITAQSIDANTATLAGDGDPDSTDTESAESSRESESPTPTSAGDRSTSDTSGENVGFTSNVPDVDHVESSRSGAVDETVEAGKLESFLNSEDFDDDADTGVSSQDSSSGKPQSLADARRSSKLPLVGEGTDWVAGDDSHDIPAGFPIKGNANSGIYHPEESPSYKETIAEIYFANGDLAEAHGYRLPKMLQKLADKAAAEAANDSVTNVDEEDDKNG